MRLSFVLTLVFFSCAGLVRAHKNHVHHQADRRLHEITVKGDRPLERKIRSHQDRLAGDRSNAALIENLGWLFISKARTDSDETIYAHALQCAEELRRLPGSKHQGQLLQGHVYLQEHRFQEARAVAQALVKERGWHYDHGLLGDVLFDLGDTEGAIAAYEEMMQQRPGLESFARASQVRWRRGQLDGAIEAMELAVSAGSLRSPEPLAWAYTKLAAYHLQKSNHEKVVKITNEAIRLVPHYPGALLLRGRGLMAQGNHGEALPWLRKAARLRPEPAYLWALADCLRSAGDVAGSAVVEEQLHRTGAASDPRTYALFLATTGQQAELAVALSRDELKERQDLFTHGAHAWALAARGNDAPAYASMQTALEEGTHDARLSLHAGVIASRVGQDEEARQHFERAERYRAMLLPSELRLLNESRENLRCVHHHNPKE